MYSMGGVIIVLLLSIFPGCITGIVSVVIGAPVVSVFALVAPPVHPFANNPNSIMDIIPCSFFIVVG
jgi:hypothetical protein